MNGLFGKLARRYLLGKKGRSFMTLLGIALGVTMVVAVLLTNSAILDSYKDLLAAAAGRADLQVSSASGTGFTDAVLGQVAQAEGVAGAAPIISSGTQALAGERKTNATFYGIDAAADRLIRDYKLTEGRLPARAGETAISTELAVSLGLGAGGRLNLLTTTGLREFQVVGIFDAEGTVRGSLGPFGVLELKAAAETFGKAGKLDLIDILLEPGVEAEQVQERLAEQLGTTVRVGTPVERSKDMQKLLDSVLFLLNMGGAISLFAGAFIIYTNVAMGVAERRRDMSILRALGMRKGEVLRLVLLEAGLLGLLGAVLGTAWGYGLASVMAKQMSGQFLVSYGLEAAAVTLTWFAAGMALAVGIGTAVVAAYGPARATVGVSPVEAMRPQESGGVAQERHGLRKVLAGLGLLLSGAGTIWVVWPEGEMLTPLAFRLFGLALVLMLLGVVVLLPVALPAINRAVLRPVLSGLFGVTGRLASDNLVRQPARTAATVCALMVSLTFMVAMGGVKASQTAAFDRWYSKVVQWDMNISTSFAGMQAQVEMDPAVGQQLAAVDGVTLVSPQKFFRLTLSDGEGAMINAFDYRELRKYSETALEEGTWPEVANAMERGGAALISPAIGRRLGIGMGDSLTLPTPSGEQDFRVVGILTDITPYGGTIQLDRADYVRHWQDETSTSYAVMVEDGADPAAVREAIRAALGEEAHLWIRLNQEFWAELRGVYDGFYGMMDGLIWIAVLVSGLAIANTLLASILERRREFGIIRAVGTRRGEVMRVVIGEALATGLVGGAIGLVAGLAQMVIMVYASELSGGADTDLTFDWASVAVAMAVAGIFAPLVGLVPARWAARMDVVEALRYE